MSDFLVSVRTALEKGGFFDDRQVINPPLADLSKSGSIPSKGGQAPLADVLKTNWKLRSKN